VSPIVREIPSFPKGLWYTVPALWPSKRSYELFRQWFDPELHTVLTDLGQGAIYDDEL